MKAFTRRQFLAGSATGAAGLIIPLELFAQPGTLLHLSPWIRIGTDDAVVLYMSQSEMGQAIYTGVAQILADELDAEWSRIRLERAPVRAPCQVTLRGNSRQGTALLWRALRNAGATGREMLIQAASQRWQVPVSECTATDGFVVHASGKRYRYSELATAAAALPVPPNPRLKTRAEYRYIGKPLKRLDTVAKTTGSALFGIDVRVPGTLYAAVRHCPVFGGKIAGFNDAAICAMPGVRAIVPVANGFVVVADHQWKAFRAADAMVLQVEPGSFSSVKHSHALRAALDAERAAAAVSRGAGATLIAGAAKVVEADYEVPYLAHAPMEPLCATADVRADGCTMWVPTQQQTFSMLALAKVLGLAPERIQINTTYLGGGFGRKGVPDFVLEAALASKAVGKPVKLMWSREEDIQQDRYRPGFMGRFRAGLDANGDIVGLSARLAAQSLPTQVVPPWIRGRRVDRRRYGDDDLRHPELACRFRQYGCADSTWLPALDRFQSQSVHA